MRAAASETRNEVCIGLPYSERRPGTAPRRSGKIGRILLASLLVGLLGSGYLYQQSRIIHLADQVEQTKTEMDHIRRQNLSKNLQITTLQSPDRIEYLAINKLGLVKPSGVLLEETEQLP